MMRRPRASSAALALAALLAIGGCDPGTAEVSPPTAEPVLPDDAEPRAVLESFLKTLAIRDCAGSRALSTDEGFRQVGGLCDRIHVVDFRVDGERARPNPVELVFATTLRIDRTAGERAGGATEMFFTLERQPNGAWRIAGGGTRR